MDRYEKAALLDFVATVIWPSRTVRVVTAALGEDEFDVIGSWDTTYDTALAWVNGNRVSGAITWLSATRVQLPSTAALGAQVVILVSPGSGSGYLPRDPAGSVAMLGDLLMGNNRLRNLGAGVAASDGVRLDQVQALIRSQLGANYVAKAGDQMAGALLLAADDVLKPTAAVRRNLVALLDATQDFTGKIKGVTTLDADPDTTLTTKDWVSTKVAADLASLRFPSRSWVRTTPGTYTLAIPAGVTQIFAHLRAGDGGGGGIAMYGGAYGSGGNGAKGARACVIIPIRDSGETITIIVGGGGQAGGNAVGGTPKAGGGGGGGGASQIQAVAGTVTAGGGGAGGASGNDGWRGGAGGAGGVAGEAKDSGFAAAPGNLITLGGGVGGAGGLNASGSSASDNATVDNPAGFLDAPTFIITSDHVVPTSAPDPGTGASGATAATAGGDGVVEFFY